MTCPWCGHTEIIVRDAVVITKGITVVSPISECVLCHEEFYTPDQSFEHTRRYEAQKQQRNL